MAGIKRDEIREYITEPSDKSFSAMMSKKKKLIDESIRQLLSVQAFLEQKADRIQLGMKARHGEIQLCTLPERKIMLSSPMNGNDDEDVSVAAEFSLRLKKHFELYDSFGSCISVENLKQNKFQTYHSYFAYCPEGTSVYDEILPAGTYLQTFCIGNWDKLPDVYCQILAYAREHHIELSGYAYEEGLNEMSLSNMDDYITRIMIGVKA